MTLVISDLRTDQTEGETVLSALIAREGEKKRAFFAISGNHPDAHNVEAKFDPFLTAMLLPSMMRSEPIVVEGDIEANRLFHMRRDMQRAISKFSTKHHCIDITAESRVDQVAPDTSKGAIIGMSCGIDSLHSYFETLENDAPKEHKIKTLMHNDVGAHRDQHTFERHLARAKDFAERKSLPLITVRSNIVEFQLSKFVSTSPLVNGSTAMAIEHIFNTFLFAHGGWTAFNKPPASKGNPKIDALEGIFFPMLSNQNSRYEAASYGEHRLQKLLDIIDHPDTPKDLLVCTHDAHPDKAELNCGVCEKCAFVMLVAETNDVLDQFAGNFDIENFKNSKARVFIRLLRQTVGDRQHPKFKNLVFYLHDRGYPLPFWLKIFKNKFVDHRMTY